MCIYVLVASLLSLTILLKQPNNAFPPPQQPTLPIIP